MKLHIGCGSKRLEGYVNIDIRSTPAADIVMDATVLPYADNTVEEIFCCHMIEHLTKEEGEQFLKECYRVLRSNGVLRLELPVIDLVIENAWKAGAAEQLVINMLYGLQRYTGDYHKYGYTRNTLRILLEQTGFCLNAWCVGRTGHPGNKTGAKVECIKS